MRLLALLMAAYALYWLIRTRRSLYCMIRGHNPPRQMEEWIDDVKHWYHMCSNCGARTEPWVWTRPYVPPPPPPTPEELAEQHRIAEQVAEQRAKGFTVVEPMGFFSTSIHYSNFTSHAFVVRQSEIDFLREVLRDSIALRPPGGAGSGGADRGADKVPDDQRDDRPGPEGEGDLD